MRGARRPGGGASASWLLRIPSWPCLVGLLLLWILLQNTLFAVTQRKCATQEELLLVSAALERGDRALAAGALAPRSGSGGIRGSEQLSGDAAALRVEQAVKDLAGAWAGGESAAFAAPARKAEEPLGAAAAAARFSRGEGAAEATGVSERRPANEPAPPPPTTPAAVRIVAAPVASSLAGAAPALLAEPPRALLVICYNRADYLRRTLTAVLERLPSRNRPHIYVSQDGNVDAVSAVIGDFTAQFQRR